MNAVDTNVFVYSVDQYGPAKQNHPAACGGEYEVRV